ncbi:SnoaL-like domain-containing protein [Mesorhizobium albiziae]|uniref:SnoaL-like domain-containing protein n=1 Tax=Neomesorhizobium albiziae TaxID=335020 RepID=A0A1I3WRF3_9HYPH|nr:nuclear transport factor 2 family protein [Mesorhizobium albiziae]GLS31835.1 isomerase [Mesorhizobium albiziae]SFK10042.1 SnoaL-like domain-containing protein [Mesorhizobium albiziae]
MSLDVTQLIDRYCAVWNEADPARRKALLNAVWADGATYTDPRADTAGADELLAHIARVRESRPGARILRTSTVDVHHDVARFGWSLVEADGTERPGLDIALLSPDGRRIERIIGFFGPLQAGEAG